MSDQVKHKSQRSVTRMFGQTLDANGTVVGNPVEVRLAHLFLHKKRTKSAGGAVVKTPHFYTSILVPKLHNDPTQCPNYKLLSDHCMEAATKAWNSWPQGGKWPVQDGDVPHQQKPKPGVAMLTPEQITARNKWRVGYWVVEATHYLDPGPKVCVFSNGVPTEIPGQSVNGHELYKSGDFAYVSLNAWTFHDPTGPFGCNFGFEGVAFTRPGERIGSSGQKSAAQMFAGAVAPPAPAAGPAPGPAPAAPMAPGPQYAPAAPVAPFPPQGAPVAPQPGAYAPTVSAATPAPMPTAPVAYPSSMPPMPTAPMPTAPMPAAPGGPPLPAFPR